METCLDDFLTRKDSISDELTRIIRLATHHNFFQRGIDKKAQSEQIENLKLDLFGAVSIAHTIRLMTLFQDGRNSLRKFINVSQNLNKIDKNKATQLKQRLDLIRNQPEYNFIKSLRDKVHAHWDEELPVKPENAISINKIIDEVVFIFAEAGGDLINQSVLSEDVLMGWKDLVKHAKNI